ncbi:MAG TPA: DNA polymerase III subunit alpha [Deltaproteobacteria bacterium]|nr:MAG: DNA polymerase III subunit alpha [Deltaproteobacteria bacterium GWA2_55_82]OGQ63028.1 MAG: DNA polymerase III subunit alpha [Deltaproteobacteria bacterium RIFCSPLOWO2_02_FULL_55_12]OIJ72993.1 MAG: DNA polymerase III subunit alpha [Deltaproteobacteria bacterium GWC2_55_46]HBG45997.1 DNA polymerase III subunit alpha [Deltaproteobacteria bacterium]HCY11785.1 DNA polymerase III subunit alpha [Deltaproteobacteria bacterium]
MHHSNFVHLHLHSQYSLLDGAIRPEALIALAKEYRMPAVAVTDHGNLFGAVEFYQKAMQKGVKPIIGCELYVAPGARTEKTAIKGEYAFHLVLLVKNLKGYQNLCKLLTRAYTEGFYYKPRVDKEILKEYNEGLIALSACLHGEVAYNLSIGQREAAENTASEYKAIFGGRRFYLEIQHNGIEEQERVNKELVQLGKKLDIPLVATNDCHYLKKEDSRVHDVLLCIQTGTTVNAANRMRFSTDEFYVKSPEEMVEAFKDTPEAIANTIEIAERCNFELSLGKNFLPEYPVPEGETLDSIIDAKAREGLEKRLATMRKAGADVEALKWQYYDRLEKELKVIKGMGFPGYFLIVTDFIDYARSVDIPVGPGRGSAAGSLVAYSLGITNIDPIRYNLLFERFLNPDRISLPDIDIDFCFEKRDEVIKYVTRKYGADKVSQIITFGQMKAKACIRDVGRALDMPYGDVDKIAKLVPNTLNITIKEAIEQEARLKELYDKDPKVRELLDTAVALEGLPRHASTHAAGVVISNRPLEEYLPLYKQQKEDSITTQYTMKDVEKIGLVKFDFLGLKTLTVIDKTVKFVRSNRDVDLDIEALPLADEKTYSLIASGESNGVFQLESSGMKELLRKLKPTTFEDLIAAVALYRPGPLQSGMVDDFINRKHKKTVITYEVPELKGILENTYGVMVYQEQVMEIAKVLAGYTPGDADVLRKAMGKKLPEEMLVQRTRFLEGSKKKNIDQKKAEKIYDLMAKFAGYGFNKSHSAAYALIAFQTAYLKAHYTAEFMAALLGADMGNTDQVVKYINECKELGIGVDPPDLNESSMEFTVSGKRIRFGLAAVKNVGEAAIDEMLRVRQDGKFTSMLDFLSRVDSRKVNKKVIESLIRCGAFDFTKEKRAQLMAELDPTVEAAQSMQRDRELGQSSLFDAFGGGGGGEAVKPSINVPRVIEWENKELLAYEKETLGFYFSAHPLSGYKRELALYATAIDSLSEKKNEDEVTIGGIIAELKEITTKKGDRMAFARIEDLTGSVEAVIFSDLYKKVRDVISSGSPLIVSGRLDKEEDEVKLIATGMVPIEEAGGQQLKSRNTHIHAPVDGLTAEKLMELKKVIQEHPGTSTVIVHLVYPDNGSVIIGVNESLKMSPQESAVARIKELIDGAQVEII